MRMASIKPSDETSIGFFKEVPVTKLPEERLITASDPTREDLVESSSVNIASSSDQIVSGKVRHPLPNSYCNPGYLRSRCIPQGVSSHSRSQSANCSARSLPFPTRLPSCFDGQGTGFAVGNRSHSDWAVPTDTPMWSQTEYRDRFQPGLNRRLAHDSNL